MSDAKSGPSAADPLAAALLELRDFDTALLANTIGYIDATPPDRWYAGGSIRSVTPTIAPSCGIAVTCKLDSSTPGQTADMDAFWMQLEQMQHARVPTVWVVQCIGSRPDHECVIGDGMGKMLAAVGCVAVVTDGGVRDIRGLHTIPIAAYCRGPVIHHGPMRITAAGEPVEIGGITINAGDVLHGDAEGVIKIPRACVTKLSEAAVRMRAAENDVHLLLRRLDLSVAEKRSAVPRIFDKFGFGEHAAPHVEPR